MQVILITFYQDENNSTAIGENQDIVDYIKEKIDDGLVEIMLHGYNHLYSFECDGVIKTATKKRKSTKAKRFK